MKESKSKMNIDDINLKIVLNLNPIKVIWTK